MLYRGLMQEFHVACDYFVMRACSAAHAVCDSAQLARQQAYG
jgi:hypothetical protein